MKLPTGFATVPGNSVSCSGTERARGGGREESATERAGGGRAVSEWRGRAGAGCGPSICMGSPPPSRARWPSPPQGCRATRPECTTCGPPPARATHPWACRRTWRRRVRCASHALSLPSLAVTHPAPFPLRRQQEPREREAALCLLPTRGNVGILSRNFSFA